MNIIVAHTHEQGRFFAQHMNHWPRDQYRIMTGRPDVLRGLRDVTIWFLSAPRFRPNGTQMEHRYEARLIVGLHKHNNKIEEFTLP